ncbi:MAG: hypothetical protein Q7J28_17720 [Caulobacter sp.]|nr:hypothetical protein [Caulobacter sp.]
MNFSSEYAPHLKRAEDLTANVLKFAPPPGPEGDAFRADLAGLLAIAYVAAFENCVKAIFVAFGTATHPVLGTVTEHHFEKLASKVHYDSIGNKYALQFGQAYKAAYENCLKAQEAAILAASQVSMKNTYANILTWRHKYAHEGVMLTTLEEITAAYPTAKRVIEALDNAMSI